ncbi:MAG TPA: hypothetical protein VM841_04015 [Actinomycetota bacterium]|nr:hypothetical protein [Actinomycetota bacterium]
MSRKLATIVAALAVAAPAGGTFASHAQPPQYVDAPGVTITITSESSGDEVYHDRNTAGRSGTKCTAAGSDDPNDNARECWNDRSQLRDKDVTNDQGTPASCRRIQGQTVPGVATWDGVWFNRTPSGTIPDTCGDPTTGGAKGRVYTGAAATSVGSAGVAGGGDLVSGGCVQGFVEDDTPGNLVSSAVTQAQVLAGQPHSGGDDDTDAGVCFDYL